MNTTRLICILVLLSLYATFAVTPRPAFACEPLPEDVRYWYHAADGDVLPLDQLAAKSRLVVVGQVVGASRKPYKDSWGNPQRSELSGDRIWGMARIAVDVWLKGEGASTIHVAEFGGGGDCLPPAAVGDRRIYLLERYDGDDDVYQLMPWVGGFNDSAENRDLITTALGGEPFVPQADLAARLNSSVLPLLLTLAAALAIGLTLRYRKR